jgi:hypothetical protein
MCRVATRFAMLLLRLFGIGLAVFLEACGVIVHNVASSPVAFVGADDKLQTRNIPPYYAKGKTIYAGKSEFIISPMNDVVSSSYSFILFIPFDRRGREGEWEHHKPFMVDVMFRLKPDTKWEIIDPSLVIDKTTYQAKLYDAGEQVCYNVKPDTQLVLSLPYSLSASGNNVPSLSGDNFHCLLFAFSVETPEPEKSFIINFGSLYLKGKKVPFTVQFGTVRYTSGGG